MSFFSLPLAQKLNKKHRIILKKAEHNKKLTQLRMGDWGIKSLESGLISLRQLDSLTRLLRRVIKPSCGQVWFRKLSFASITQKPNEVRMGRGKGPIKYWVVPYNAGSVLFEISGLPSQKALDLLRVLQTKIPFRTTLTTVRQ